jgi:D-xylulose reductase
VRNVKIGDRVAMEPGVSCRRCEACKTGRYQVCDSVFSPVYASQSGKLCSEMAFAATPPYDGTLARYYRLPEDLVYTLPESLSLEDGAMV